MKNIINEAYMQIDEFRQKLGEVVVEEFMKDDNSAYEIARSIIGAFESCKSDDECIAANRMLIAITGWGIDTLIEKIKEKDASGYKWEGL